MYLSVEADTCDVMCYYEVTERDRWKYNPVHLLLAMYNIPFGAQCGAIIVQWRSQNCFSRGGGTHLTRDGDEGEGRLSRPHTNVEISRGALARCATPWLRHYIIPVQRCLHEHAKLLFP